MKKQSKILAIITLIINCLCFLQALGTAILLVLIPFLPPYFKFNFSVKTDGLFSALDKEAFSFIIPEVIGIAYFTENSPTNYLLNSTWFLLSLLTLFILLQFKDFVNSVYEKRTFEAESYKRFRYMGFAFFGILIIEALSFIFVEVPMARLVQHESININPSYMINSNFNWNIFFLGLTFLVLAEVFKEGFSLKQESELTI